MSARTLFALTLHQPWASLIAHGFKPVENRKWAPDDRLRPGQWLAIHAGKRWGEDGVDLGIRNGVPPAFFDTEARVAAAIVGVARFDGVVRLSDDPSYARKHPWFAGPVGWLLSSAVAIEPVPCRGWQKLWPVKDDVAELVRARFRALHRMAGAA